MLIQHYDTSSLLAEIESWLDAYMPPPEVLENFCVLLEHGFSVNTNSPTSRNCSFGTITAKKDYIKVYWAGSNKQTHVSIKCGDGYVRAKESSGIEKFGRLVDVEHFLADPPPNRNPLYEYDDVVGLDFVPCYTIDDGTVHCLDAIETTNVKFICRLYKGVILTDIDDPAVKNLWFVVEYNGNKRSGTILYNKSKWLSATQLSDRVYKDTKLKLTIHDKEILDFSVDAFVKKIYGR